MIRVPSLYYRKSAAGESSLRRSVSNPMARETEIKLRISDVRAFHRALKRIGARPGGPGSSKVHEENVIFDTPQGGLAKHGQLLRIRTETPEIRGKAKTTGAKQRVVLTFKQPMVQTPVAGLQSSSYGSYKIREEIELEVTDPGNLTRIFEGLGMSGWFRNQPLIPSPSKILVRFPGSVTSRDRKSTRLNSSH